MTPSLRGALLLACILPGAAGEAGAQALEAPTLHHAHLNSTDPAAAAAWYQRIWPDGRVGEMAGYPAFLADMALLFTRVDAPPAGAWDPTLQRAEPQSAFWHIGGFLNTTDVFQRLAAEGVTVLPLWIGPDDRDGVSRSGLTPYSGIRTAGQLDGEAEPPREGGFGYLVGPDGALVELTGGPRTTPSFSHVHLFHEEPRCAANWYVENLAMAFAPRRDPDTGAVVPGSPWPECNGAERGDPGWPSLEHRGTIRAPSAGIRYGNGGISFYPRQCVGDRCGTDRPLVTSRGQVLDHVAFAVDDLDRWMAHLSARGVRILEGPYAFGAGRAVLLHGPDGLAIELVDEGPPPEE